MAIHAALEASDYARARDLIAGMRAFEDIRAEELNGTNVTGVKAALQALGQDCGPTRPPSAWPLTETQTAKMHDIPGLQRPDLTRGERTMLDKATFTPHGRHLIAGEWVAGETTFRSEPATGEAHAFSVGTPALVDRAAEAAEEAFWSYGYASREERAAFLDAHRRRDRGARRGHHRDRQRRRPACPRRGSKASAGAPSASSASSPTTSARATISTAATTWRCPTASRCRGPDLHDDPAADRPGRGVRRLELPARLLDRRRRHRRGARRRLPGGGQGPLGASRAPARSSRRRSTPPSRARASTPASSA